MSRPRSRPEPLGPAVQALVRSARSALSGPTHRVWEVWEEVVGPDLAARARPLSVRSGVLTVGVTSSAWAQQLSFLRAEILSRLNAHLAGTPLKALRTRVVEPGPPPAGPPPPPERPAPGPVPGWARERVRRATQEVGDREVRRALERLWLRHLETKGVTEVPEDAPPPGSTGDPSREEPGEA